MKREDLRGRIIATTIENTDELQKTGNKKFNTCDLIYLDSYDEQYDEKKTDMDRRISATDYAQMNNAYIYDDFVTRAGKQSTRAWLRSAHSSYTVYIVSGDDDCVRLFTYLRSAGLCPSLHFSLPVEIESQDLEQFDIREVKDLEGKTIYHTIQIGEYPKTKVDEDLSIILESLYNNGRIQEELICTGRWYSGNGQIENSEDYAEKHSPEFEYQGKRYVRVVSSPNIEENRYSDGTLAGKKGTIRWVKVEPISFIIKNWNEMPKNINPNGSGKAKYFDLKAEEVIISNIPFYLDIDDKNVTMWQNSSIRGFLNGIDVRNIKTNGNAKYGASRGGNFTGKCNFLNEAFNLSREPIVEYVIPDSDTSIPDDAFNGCISLKKLVIHPKIEHIGKRAFEGLNFRYAYRTQNGELIFSQEIPQNKEEYINIIEFSKIEKSFSGFDCGFLVQSDKIGNLIRLSEVLSKNKFSIPYIFGLALIESGNEKSFCENSYFGFFKNEISKINDMLVNFPEEERLDFFKFANSLGCFSTEKILDKNGKETEIPLAQKATSLLNQLLKTDEMRLR